MKKYLTSLVCDFEEYTIELDFLAYYQNTEKAKKFASNCVYGIELLCDNIKIIVKHSNVSSVICKCYKIKKIKNEAIQKSIIDMEKDYIQLDYDASSLFAQLCTEYEVRTSFVFSCSSYSVKEC